VVGSLAIRWLALRGANWRIDYDEGMVGLQVLRVLRGQLAVFHPGQPYLGNLETYLLAPFFVLFGANDPTLKMVPLLLSGAYVATTGLVGRAAFDARSGALAALVAAVAPAYLVIVGLKAWGATIESLVLGNLLLLITLRIVKVSAHPRRDYLLLGFVAGVAFWISWLVAFYALPVALILLRRMQRDQWRYLVLATLAFVAGSLPLWVYNIVYPLATFSFLLGGEKADTLGNAPRVLKHFAADLAPRLVSGDPTWHVLNQPSAWALVIVYGAGAAALLALSLRRRHDSGLLSWFLVCFLPIYVLSGFGNNALALPGVDATGRYVLMLHSVLPIGVALLACRKVGLLIVAGAMALNLLGVAMLDPVKAFASPYYRDQPATLQPLIDLLDARGIDHIWTDVGIAHVLMFETGERILAADYYDTYYAHGLIRFPEVIEAVAKADRVAFVELIRPGQVDTPIDRAFTTAGVDYERLTPSPELLVIIPKTRIDPATVLAGLGFQY
jgi:4-amino-4-deoxy-L-arabinose transferase-like glycosyltransferase